jgi:hypothetical protein
LLASSYGKLILIWERGVLIYWTQVQILFKWLYSCPLEEHNTILSALALSRKAPIILAIFVRPSVRLSPGINAASTGLIKVEFDIGDFYEYLWSNSRFGWNRAIYMNI